MRLDKLLAMAGLGARSSVRALVRGGRVTVNGGTARDPALAIDPQTAAVAVDGVPLRWRAHRHIMLHKPAGVITAAQDTRLPTVMGLLPPTLRGRGLAPVGRLDRDVTGLLLLTDDGALAHRLISPRRGIEKLYLATVDGPLDAEDISAFAQGLALRDGPALPATLTVLRSAPQEAQALCAVREGRFHQVKRMFAARGRAVTCLQRLAIGPLRLDETLAPGAWRELNAAEARALYAAAGLEETHDL
ncbi:MAG: rRNA pseudouridine synthase [Oscillospiraceae bacterium]|nr:rRNA pseudouridine synthase [Oscillospiraceae bacterium]